MLARLRGGSSRLGRLAEPEAAGRGDGGVSAHVLRRNSEVLQRQDGRAHSFRRGEEASAREHSGLARAGVDARTSFQGHFGEQSGLCSAL